MPTTTPIYSTEKHWSDYWSQSSPVEHDRQFNPIRISHIESALHGVSDKCILEAGCGTALDTIELAKRGAIAIAFDYSVQALTVARRNATLQQTQLLSIQGNILNLPFAEDTIDCVFHAGVLEHFRNPDRILVEQRRVLKPGGIMLVDVPQTFNLYTLHKARKIRANSWFAGWETQFTISALETLVQSVGFQIVATYGYGYYPAALAKLRWASSIGKGFAGRSLMPSTFAAYYDTRWEWFEHTRAFLYFAQNIGVVAIKA